MSGWDKVKRNLKDNSRRDNKKECGVGSQLNFYEVDIFNSFNKILLPDELKL